MGQALLNKEKILQEKQNQITQHTQEQTSTTQATNRGTTTENYRDYGDNENILERNSNRKRNNDTSRIMKNNQGFPAPERDQQAGYEL